MLDDGLRCPIPAGTDLVEIDCGFPVVVSEQVEVSHTDFTEVTVPIVSRLASQLNWP